MKKIHVNQGYIKSNVKNGTDYPVITIKEGKKNSYAHEVEILGPSRIVYPEKKMACGARVWIETDSEIRITRRASETPHELKAKAKKF